MTSENSDLRERYYAALGRMFIEWSHLEQLIWQGLELLAQKDREKERSGYFKIPPDRVKPLIRARRKLFPTAKQRDEDKKSRTDFKGKLQLWKTLNESLLKHDLKHVERVTNVVPHIEKLQEQRNRFIHGKWEIHLDRPWALQHEARVTISTEQKPFREVIELQSILELCQLMVPTTIDVVRINARVNKWAQSREWLKLGAVAE